VISHQYTFVNRTANSSGTTTALITGTVCYMFRLSAVILRRSCSTHPRPVFRCRAHV